MYTKKEVQENAIVDAKNNLPAKDDPKFSQFEQEMMAMAKNEARQIKTKHEPELEILSVKHKPLLKDYQRISKDYEEHSAKIKRSEPSVELARGKYYILMLLFVLGEIPMNSLAFSVFGESQIFTWIMALGVAVAIPWIAHAVGILLKRGSDPWWKSGLGVGTLLFLTIGGLLAIGYVRVEYLGDLNAASAGSISSFGNSKLIGAAFIGLNLVILAAATLCSYFAHDKDPLSIYIAEPISSTRPCAKSKQNTIRLLPSRIRKLNGFINRLRKSSITIVRSISANVLTIKNPNHLNGIMSWLSTIERMMRTKKC